MPHRKSSGHSRNSKGLDGERSDLDPKITIPDNTNVTIYMAGKMLKQIDEVRNGITRSEWIKKLIAKELKKYDGG